MVSYKKNYTASQPRRQQFESSSHYALDCRGAIRNSAL